MTYDSALLICLEPVRVDWRKGSEVPVWACCRKCKKCLDRRHTDISGRCMAEALCSDRFVSLTLTYNKWTGTRAQHLFYRDVQLLLKRLRKDGHKVRYLCAGEYGSKRERAHWHIVLFFTGEEPKDKPLRLPPIETEKEHWHYWSDFPHHKAKSNGPVPIGFVFVQRPDYHGMRYVVKYACKDEGKGKSTRSVMPSKKPPLGALYWPRLARQEIAQGLPFRFSYELPDCRYANGNPVQFYATGASALLKWKAYADEWHKLHPTKAPPIAEKALRAWWRVCVPPKVRAYLADKERRVKLQKKRDTYVKAKVFKNGALLKVPSGDIIAVKFNGFGLELSAWRVVGLKEMVQFARERRVDQPRKLRHGEAPF